MFAISKIVLVLYFGSIVTVVTSACLKYGHACWGGHGKRSGSFPKVLPASQDLISQRNQPELHKPTQFLINNEFIPLLVREEEIPREIMNDIIADFSSNPTGINLADGEEKSPFFIKFQNPNLFSIRDLLTKRYNQDDQYVKKVFNKVNK